jgi:hypothetical protein
MDYVLPLSPARPPENPQRRLCRLRITPVQMRLRKPRIHTLLGRPLIRPAGGLPGSFCPDPRVGEMRSLLVHQDRHR